MFDLFSAAIDVCTVAKEPVTLDRIQNMILSLPTGKTEDELEQDSKRDTYFRRILIQALENEATLRHAYHDVNEAEFFQLMKERKFDEYEEKLHAAVPELPLLNKSVNFLSMSYGLLEKDTRIIFDLAFSGFVFMAQKDNDFAALCNPSDQKIETTQERMNASLDAEKLRAFFQEKTSGIGLFETPK